MVKLPVKDAPLISLGSIPSILYDTCAPTSTPCVDKSTVMTSPSSTSIGADKSYVSITFNDTVAETS